MKLVPPLYYEAIRQEAESRWEKLENDPETHAIWRQMFRQIQSPRHVLSELMQNADDAGATDVSVRIQDGVFIFEHNGRDFLPEEFGSLCRFGYSNKRTLHTIGFRGIGFKSTFSLGDTVGLQTPTLHVLFEAQRFSYPVWADGDSAEQDKTRITIQIKDHHLEKHITNSMKEWIDNPFPLLFFNNIQSCTINATRICWQTIGPGPVPNSKQMRLSDHDETFLVLQSEKEDFPQDALDEINKERFSDPTEDIKLPPCSVEIVLGAPGNIFVILPTGVQTLLPFAINAPFIQDPARLKIKEPSLSPTNRWLLNRVGKLAAEAMIAWLENGDLKKEERAGAYDLLVPLSKEDFSLASECAQIVEESMLETLDEKEIILTESGALQLPGTCHAVPAIIWKIWNHNQISTILRDEFLSNTSSVNIVAKCIDQNNLQKLFSRDFIQIFSDEDIFERLKYYRPPKPRSWSSLLVLWQSVDTSIWGLTLFSAYNVGNACICPVAGKDVLYSRSEVVRLPDEPTDVLSQEKTFFFENLNILDPSWIDYAKQKKDTLESNGFGKPGTWSAIVGKLAEEFWNNDNKRPIENVKRLTQICAKLNLKVPEHFFYLTRNQYYHPITSCLVRDSSGSAEDFLIPEEKDKFLLDPIYEKEFSSCSKREWSQWIRSGNAGIKPFIPLSYQIRRLTEDRFKELLEIREYQGKKYEGYRPKRYTFYDWDFPRGHWEYWKERAETEPDIWGRLFKNYLADPNAWNYALSSEVRRDTKGGKEETLIDSGLVPVWILRLRTVPCLPDTHGNFHQPASLLRRTPQTIPLLEVETFIDEKLDTEKNRPLLDLLGVSTSPTDHHQILERIRALAKASKPPVYELVKWYHRLDSLYNDLSSENHQSIAIAFSNEDLIYSQEGGWHSSKSIYITANENDVPDAPIIYHEAGRLSLWRKIGVEERPTAELAINWLKELPSGDKISSSDLRRVRSLLGRYSFRIYETCKHWLNLSGEWMPVEDLHYSRSMQSLVRYADLHEWVKSQTADLEMLNRESAGEAPFTAWPTLASQLEKRPEDERIWGEQVSYPWLDALSKILTYVHLPDEEKTKQAQSLARRLSATVIEVVDTLRVTPYLDGTPAGMPEEEALAWIGEKLYVTTLPKAKLVKQLADTLAGVFGWPDLREIISYCYARSEQDIVEYLNENLTISLEEEQQEVVGPGEEQNEGSDNHSLPEDMLPGNVEELGGLPQRKGEPKPKTPRKPRKAPENELLPLIERYALQNGYRKILSQYYRHRDGRSLSKPDGVFHWQISLPDASFVRYLWVKEHCLQAKPLEIPSEVWHLLEQDPIHHAFILEDEKGNPAELLGTYVTELKAEGKITIHPATYRLVMTKID